MKSLSASLVTVVLFVAGVSAQSFQINTPNPPTECVPVQFTWTGGDQPFFLAITPGGVTGASALQQYSGLTGSSFTWSTNITAGTSIGLTLTDSTGAVAQSAPFTIQSGPDTSCLTGSSSATTSESSGSTTAAATTGATSATSGATSATSATSKASSASGSATGSKSSSSAATSSSASSSTDNGALSNAASAGVVGLVGAIAAAFLA